MPSTTRPPVPRPGDACAFLFAGTGAATAPDLRALTALGPAAGRAAADAVDAVQEGLPRTGWPSLRTLLLDDPAAYPAAAARTPGVAQLSGYAASVATDRALRTAGIHPSYAVGQSFGELAALVCAGAFGVPDGARMAVHLVDVLTRHAAAGGMGLLEAGEDDTLACVKDADAPDVVIAGVNAPAATLVSGPVPALEDVLDTARRRGVRAVRLAVPYLSHHPALTGVDDIWYRRVRDVPQRPLEVEVHSPVRGRAYHDDDDLHRALADCIVRPVRLPDALRAVRAAGATLFAEAGAGAALTQCARLTLPGARTLTPMRRPRTTRQETRP
ncbi:ACP S-malonyltransferase [Spirillospora albida]|uniref:ACP S-malonyltransferase n=1 Tax=Spirillospora albida TaxID=58123 RepID=UPI0004C05E1A|nr:acyltransferase domain-containing protein [Spirillospora albida]